MPGEASPHHFRSLSQPEFYNVARIIDTFAGSASSCTLKASALRAPVAVKERLAHWCGERVVRSLAENDADGKNAACMRRPAMGGAPSPRTRHRASSISLRISNGKRWRDEETQKSAAKKS